MKKRLVSTFAGTGKLERQRPSSGKLLAVGLNSPWAIVHVKGTLYICMAGSHQVWSHTLGSDEISVYAGTGREDIIDGVLRDSALAQPSGITTDGKFLYLADSEGSAIRKLDLDPAGKISTIAGASDLPFGRALFEFGDKDGIGSNARLQHPLGVAYHNKTLYVADAYNHKIRKIEFTPQGGKVTTWIGDGKRGKRLSPPRLSEPEGVSVAGGKLFIADTNNHRICVADLKTGKLSILNIPGLKPPQENAASAEIITVGGAETINLKPVIVAAANHVSVRVKVSLPSGFKLNKLYPSGFQLKVEAKQQLIAADFAGKRHAATVENDGISFSLPLAAKNGKATIELALSFGYCRAGTGGVCKLKTVRWRIPLEVSEKSTRKSIELTAVVAPRKQPKIFGKIPGR
ncbi:MAG: hypothetical protein IID45_14925 [Planctomycetes bacterium]|nr:hypothetical protein [Planctomycetota bacterium]